MTGLALGQANENSNRGALWPPYRPVFAGRPAMPTKLKSTTAPKRGAGGEQLLKPLPRGEMLREE